MNLLTHEYSLALYGVILWQGEQFFTSKKSFFNFIQESSRNIGRSMLWVGLVVVFDDELLAQYNHWAAMDYTEAPKWLYTIAGFSIDIIRTNITTKFGK
jgi:hypothetical protein